MQWRFMGWALPALFLGLSTAAAEPVEADIWLGVEGSLDGFLLDTDSGTVWMTGVCLKPVGTARRDGTVWQVSLSEMVSVGRSRTLLEQAFRLDTDAAAPSVTVSNPNRGGEQAISGIVRIDCAGARHCARAADVPTC